MPTTMSVHPKPSLLAAAADAPPIQYKAMAGVNPSTNGERKCEFVEGE